MPIDFFVKVSIIAKRYELLHFSYSLTLRQMSHRITAFINLM